VNLGELRKDYILDRWVIISSGRSKRPKEFKQESLEIIEETCFFCPGNEKSTPLEIGRVSQESFWKLRWFENKFPALTPDGQINAKTDNQFFTFAPNYGHHEVIVETPDHKKQLADLSEKDIVDLFNVYNLRIKELSKKDNVAYVNVFKNHGPYGGTSLLHSHSQVMATSYVPQLVNDKVNACRKFIECPYCKIIQAEKNSLRRCFENSTFVAFTPYASRFNFEIWIFPKHHAKNLDEVNINDLANILKKALVKINQLNLSYNFFLHYSPNNSDLHFHIEIIPRVAVWGGFEFCTNIIINSVSPEDAARFYRGEHE